MKPRRKTTVRAPQTLEREVGEFIASYSSEHGYPPAMREIAAGVGRSLSSVFEAMRRLERKGALSRHPGRPRAYVMKQTPEVQL
jgi:repressor LexA